MKLPGKEDEISAFLAALFLYGDGGIRTHAPRRAYRISSATSYDLLSTSPYDNVYIIT